MARIMTNSRFLVSLLLILVCTYVWTDYSSNSLLPDEKKDDNKDASLLSNGSQFDTIRKDAYLLPNHTQTDAVGKDEYLLPSDSQSDALGKDAYLLHSDSQPDAMGKDEYLLPTDSQPDAMGKDAYLLPTDSQPDVMGKDSYLLPNHTQTDAKDKDAYLIPNDSQLDAMGEEELNIVFWKYINSVQVLCHNQMRFGALEDGGKEVCLDEAYKPKYPCLVYSFGSSFQFDFEVSIFTHFKCEIHTFDPTKQIRKRVFPEGINFHLMGLSDKSGRTNSRGWKMNTLSNIRRRLNHTERVIDILKIDIEGGEWTALQDMIQSGELQYVKQICIEIHFEIISLPYSRRIMSLKDMLKILRDLYENGLRIFMHEHNTAKKVDIDIYGQFTPINELSMVNVRL